MMMPFNLGISMLLPDPARSQKVPHVILPFRSQAYLQSALNDWHFWAVVLWFLFFFSASFSSGVRTFFSWSGSVPLMAFSSYPRRLRSVSKFSTSG